MRRLPPLVVDYRPMRTRNIFLLTLCQMISATGSIVLVTLGGILGSRLTEHQALATLPLSVMIVSVAATTIPATMLMRAIGRKRGFALASVSSAASVLLAAYALVSSSFAWFLVSAAIFGINMAFTQQYRFAAAESVDPPHAARAISLVLVGAIGGAFVGPELVRLGQHAIEGLPYAGTLVAVALLYLLQAGLFMLLGPLHEDRNRGHALEQRSLADIVKQPLFIVAVLAGTAAYGTMTLIMTATPLSMHINDGYSIEETAQIIRIHVLGMYVPSLFSGLLIERLGLGPMMTVGGASLAVACVVGLHGHSMMHYGFALVLLGVGWNFLYVGGTTMLTLTYSMAERFKAQAMNEFSVFGTSATASLLAGTIMYLYGWHVLVLLPLPLLLAIFAGLFRVRGNARLHPLRASRNAA
ncbi:MAG TPA: MFS transporter [Woeseiaceae bacterium]|nr:MFS transporter [Woeseiaceae bacterium]